MLKVSINDAHASLHDNQLIAFFIQGNESAEKEIKTLEKSLYPGLSNIAKARKFTGAPGTSVELPVVTGESVAYFILEGIGNKKNNQCDIETYRRAVGRIIKAAQSHHISSIAIEIPAPSLFKESLEYMAEQTIIVAQMALYHYDRFITDNNRKSHRVTDLELIVPAGKKASLKKVVDQALLIGESVNLAREWVDTPPSHLTPSDLAGHAKSIAKKHDLKITVFDEKKVKELGMGGLAGVSAGSDQDCQMVILEYHCAKKNAPTLCLVGKGITFDSGGLSIKPAQSMETMKEDMSGAAAVIATMRVIAHLKPKHINVIGIAPMSENLPSGKATKPGDIVTFYNGKTAEVKNTDAEGRLILADALSYAVEQYKLDAIIDIATLTGACAYALGPVFTGMMSQHPELMKRLQESAKRSGDHVWELPLHDDYKVAIKSTIADICNIGSKKYNAGAITAGFFLQNFVGDVPWVHLDIAGTAFDVPDVSYYRPGATGVGVRLFVDLIMNWK